MSSPTQRLTGIATSVGLGMAVAGALVVATFASEETIARLAICQPAGSASPAPLAYVGAVALLALLHWAAVTATRRTAPRRGPAPVLIGVSIAGIVFSALIALLGLGFWITAGPATAAETVRVAVLFLVAFCAPSIGSLCAAILTSISRSRPMPSLLPPLAVIAATAGSAGILLVSFAASCG